ncbi:MAG: heliorhodopsin HeR, partial [Candidatus Doudnabacteria bacterium]
MDNAQRLETIAKSSIMFESLKRLNTYAGFLHLASGILVIAAVIALGKFSSWSQDIYTFYLHFTQLPGGGVSVAPDAQVAFSLGYLGVLLALFPFVSAAAHFFIAYVKNDTYNDNLKKGMNPYRWYEYAISSSIMIVLISMFTGVVDLWS